jgi:phage RecT family recombinase
MAGELAVRKLVDINRADIIKRLPTYITPERFFALCYALDKKPAIAAVAQRNPDGLLNAILQAADAGLLIGSAYNHCSIVAFGDELVLMVDYRGIIYQLTRAGALLKTVAECVYDGDLFDPELGDSDKIIHKPNWKDERRRDWKWLYDKKNIVGAYAIGWLPLHESPSETLKQGRWCPLGEIERAREVSRNKDKPGSPWLLHYPEMAKKTAVRRMAKLITVCGSTDENKEAWDRYNVTIELERSQYREEPEDTGPDDLPGEKPDKPAPKSGRTAAESASTQGAAPPSQNGEQKRTKAPAAQPPPPPNEPEPPPVDEPISDDMHDKLLELAKLQGVRPSALFKHINEKYKVAALGELKRSQAAELEKFLKAAQ